MCFSCVIVRQEQLVPTRLLREARHLAVFPRRGIYTILYSMYVYIYIYIYIYVHIEREREREIQRDRQIDKSIDRHRSCD